MPTQEPQSLSETTIVLSLTLGRVGNRRKIDSHTSAIDTTVDRDMLHVSVDLFDAPELKECQGFLNQLKAAVRSKTVPSFFRGGLYMVKIRAVEEVDAILSQAQVDFAPLVEAFADVVDIRRDESKERLGPAYDPGKYPSRAQVLSVFKIDWRWLTLETPSSLKTVSRAIFDRERQKATDSLRIAKDEINNMLALEAKGLVEHMMERLSPAEDGKPKVFRDSAVTNITEFLDNFELRDVTSNEDLNKQIERMRALLKGIAPKDLRTNDRLREDLSNGFSRVAKELDRLVIEQPTRYLDLKRKKE